MYSVQLVTSDGTLNRIVLSITYFEKDDISLYRNTGDIPLVLGVDWEWDTDTTINLLGGPEPSGNTIMLRRNTDKERAYNIFNGGASFSRETLDENFKQLVYLAQEFTEGSGLTGLYRPFNMNGFRIINLGEGVAPTDAVTKGYVDTYNAEQDNRIGTIENSYNGVTTTSIDFRTVVTTPTDTITPGFLFTKARVFVNSLYQESDTAFVIVDNTLVFAETLPAGTHVSAVLGEEVFGGTGVVTVEQFQVLAGRVLVNEGAITNLTSRMSTEEAKVQPVNKGGTGATTADDALANLGGGAAGIAVFKQGTAASLKAALGYASSGVNNDITQITGLTTPLALSQGGVGNTAGRAATATKLDVPRGIRINLASTSAVNFDGSADVTPGVTGTLGLANGGLGATTQSGARSALGIANAVVGDARNLVISIPAASATATVTADEIVLETALGGNGYKLSGLNATVNLATTGAGGMDTGTVPTTGYVAVYAIWNPTTSTASLLAVNATSARAPEVYGGANMPAGYTASALVTVWRVASSQFTVGLQQGREIATLSQTILTVNAAVASITAASIAAFVPLNAMKLKGTLSINTTNALNAAVNIFSTLAGTGVMQGVQSSSTATALTTVFPFSELQLGTAQTLYYSCSGGSGTFNQAVYYMCGYSI